MTTLLDRSRARTSVPLAVAACALVVLAGACTTTTTTVLPTGLDGGVTDTADGAAEGSAAPVLTPKAECERYLTCVNQQSPGEGGAAVALYGDASPCWKGSTADAQQCGDACRTARVAVANDGTAAPACGCKSDNECSKSFCAPEGACASADWGLALTECRAVQAKGLKPTDALPGVSCWGIEGLQCEAIKTLKRNGGSREDSNGSYVNPATLHSIYKCGVAAGARLLLERDLPPDAMPASAPAACKKAGVRSAIFRIACNDTLSSVDLIEVHEGQK